MHAMSVKNYRNEHVKHFILQLFVVFEAPGVKSHHFIPLESISHRSHNV